MQNRESGPAASLPCLPFCILHSSFCIRPMPSPQELSGVRKAAVLLLSLTQDQAAQVLKRLPQEAVEEVMREIASMGEVQTAARKDVLGEFYNLALANTYLTEGGLEYAKSLLRKSLSE